MYKNRSNRNKLQYIANRLPNTLATGLYCVNCGKHNHSLLACSEPNNSYGLLCFYKGESYSSNTTGDTKLLMIRRKHTIPYIDFLRGKYDVNNIKYLVELFTKMTYTEISNIATQCNFIKLRTNLGLNNNGTRQFKTEYETSELKFNYILNLGILHKVIICINKIFNSSIHIVYKLNFSISTDSILSEYSGLIRAQMQDIEQQTGKPPALYEDPEWGLPKGRREDRESDLQTAIREFCEETGLQMSNLRIYKNVIPLEEQYVGMNNINYKHTYFIAELINISADMASKLCNGHITTNADSHEQQTEVSKLMLLTQTDALNIIRPFHTSKKSVVHKAFYIMNQYKTFFY
jgi:hypothetical protein